MSGYWDEAVAFFRSFFNATIKTIPYMERALITGITRISNVSLCEPSESIFSDLNNLDVITTTSNKYARYFGFTEQEVFCALDSMGLGAEKQGVYEQSYGRYDVMIKPLDKQEKAFIFEFKVLNRDDDETVLEDTVANALRQIEQKEYAAELAAEGFAPEKIRKYGFAFEGKRCLIG